MKIIKFKENKDGSADMTYEINSIEEKIFKDLAKKRGVVYNHNFINSVVYEAIANGMKEDKRMGNKDKGAKDKKKKKPKKKVSCCCD
jgi:hypothetical protein